MGQVHISILPSQIIIVFWEFDTPVSCYEALQATIDISLVLSALTMLASCLD